ncbi:MAG: hypothetical protein OXB95_05280 [Rhodobacteraceae bacterium]|nr:hypothetical protein [Paracoccaceae bacterium]
MTKNADRTVIRIYNAADLSRMRNGLIDKGKLVRTPIVVERQLDLIRAAETSAETFLAQFDGIAVEGDSPALEFRPRCQPLTGQEIANPPLFTEMKHHSLLKDLPPRLAAQPSFWTSYQLEMVRRELVDPADLATPISSGQKTGRAVLQKAAMKMDEKLMDQCTRTILRQLGGLPEVRGYVSIFHDCRLSRAWWRGHISQQVAEDLGLNVNDVWTHLRVSNTTWECLQQYTVKRLTVVADRNVRSALVARLMESGIVQDTSKNRRSRTQAFLAEVGTRCAYQALGTLTPHQNLAQFRAIEV